MHHPSGILDPKWIDQIEKTAMQAEKKGEMSAEMLALIHDQGWFKLFVPENYGGLESSLPQAVRLEEALSWADGSLGWVVTLCSGAGWFGGFLSPDLALDIFNDRQVCLAGSGASTGTAAITANGYKVNGSWNYASGALHATAFTANCVITAHGKPLYHADGSPQIRSFIFKKDEVKILPKWKSIGMIATGSHSFDVTDLEVAGERAFEINPAQLVINKPLYHYPFLQFAEATLAVNSSGMAVRFLDLAEDLIMKRIAGKRMPVKQQSFLEALLKESRQKLNNARFLFYETIDDSWSCLQSGRLFTDKLKKVSENSRHLAHLARQLTDELYPFCGLAAANVETALNRVWRDIHTASQHSLLTFKEK